MAPRPQLKVDKEQLKHMLYPGLASVLMLGALLSVVISVQFLLAMRRLAFEELGAQQPQVELYNIEQLKLIAPRVGIDPKTLDSPFQASQPSPAPLEAEPSPTPTEQPQSPSPEPTP